jgi:hypothetical protein
MIQTILLFTLRPGVTDEQIEALRAGLAVPQRPGPVSAGWPRRRAERQESREHAGSAPASGVPPEARPTPAVTAFMPTGIALKQHERGIHA